MKPNSAAELAAQFRELGAHIDAGGDPRDSLNRIVVLAQATISGADWVAVTRAGARPKTLAASDTVARSIDDAQIATGEGPCLTAARDGAVTQVPDLTRENRWPAFRERAASTTPLSALLSFQVESGPPSPAALNLYSAHRDAFDQDAVTTAALFATHTQVALMHLHAVDQSTNLRQALTTSRLIGEAVGVLMATRKVTSDQAFELLRYSSQNLNRKLRDVAVDVTDTGVLPSRDRS